MRDERVLHRADGEQHPGADEGDQPAALEPHRDRPAQGAKPQLDELDHEAEEGRGEGDDGPEGPEHRGHQRTEPLGALTRPGCAAM